MNWSYLGALLCGMAVILGAFGAHGLDHYFVELYSGVEEKVVAGEMIPASAKYLRDFKTGVHYQMIHGLALLFLGLMVREQSSRLANSAGWCFLVGTVLFSGELVCLDSLCSTILGSRCSHRWITIDYRMGNPGLDAVEAEASSQSQ